MKSILIRLGCGVLAAALLAAAAGCGKSAEKAEETAAPTATAALTETTEAPSETVAPTEPTTRDPNAPSEWAAAYQKYLLKTMQELDSVKDLSFGFFYLNGDDVPELWLTDGLGAHGYSYVIATYRDGKAVEVCRDANFLDYFEKRGIFQFSGSYSAATGGGTYYQMTADGCKEIVNYEYEYKTADQVVYTINGTTVSEEEFNGLKDQYTTRYGSVKTVAAEDGFPLTKKSVEQNCK